jgi:hypothetical protein
VSALRGQSFRSVQEREGITYGVATRVLWRHLDPDRVSWLEEGEISLEIDGHSFRGTRLVHTVTDVHSQHP